MLDFRMYTFLILCDTRNYTKAAKKLSITQPAVTQHIQFLEEQYGCKLFSYSGKTLSLTEKGKNLEKYGRIMWGNEQKIEERMRCQEKGKRLLHIGATKTIGEFVIVPMVSAYLEKESRNITLTVDNTKTLLKALDQGKLDFILIEGSFDKSKYGFSTYKEEKFQGFCNAGHPFAGKTVSFEELSGERLILREKGSGTRAVLEQTLLEHNYTLESFQNITEINNFTAIKELVMKGRGVSFMYEAALKKEMEEKKIATFHFGKKKILREFNFVYLKGNLFLEDYHDFFRT
ncbi:MAG: LysR family transcriptional regulator [Acetivibrio sp.]